MFPEFELTDGEPIDKALQELKEYFDSLPFVKRPATFNVNQWSVYDLNELKKGDLVSSGWKPKISIVQLNEQPILKLDYVDESGMDPVVTKISDSGGDYLIFCDQHCLLFVREGIAYNIGGGSYADPGLLEKDFFCECGYLHHDSNLQKEVENVKTCSYVAI